MPANNIKKGKIFIISGPSGSGKTTLVNILLKKKEFKGKLVKSISLTTRNIRVNEVANRDYIFISKKMFEYKKRMSHFLESEKVFDNYYGTSKKQVEDILKKGISVVLCIDVKGAKCVCKKIKNIVSIFIKTPSISDLRKRLIERKTDSKETIDLRLKIAREELEKAKEYNYIVVNDDLKMAEESLFDIVKKELAEN